MAMGVPGWPELAAWTASIERVRMVLTQSRSRSVPVVAVAVVITVFLVGLKVGSRYGSIPMGRDRHLMGGAHGRSSGRVSPEETPRRLVGQRERGAQPRTAVAGTGHSPYILRSPRPQGKIREFRPLSRRDPARSYTRTGHPTRLECSIERR